MNTISYLKEVYGYATPIFLKDIRIGRKSKTAIRKDLSRAVERGEIVRKAQGVYCFKHESEFSDGVTFEEIVRQKYIRNNYGIPRLDLDIYGYVTGLSFLNQIGLTQQVPAVLEVVTNNTSCKREYRIKNRVVVVNKARTEINRTNWKALQFFDVINSVSDETIKKNKQLLLDYIKNNLTKMDFERNISFYPTKVIKRIVDEGLIHAFK